MNASLSRHCCLALGTLWGTARMLIAQDFIVQKDGQRREGEILGVVDGKLKIKIGPAETSIAMDQVASVTKDPPKGYEDAIKAWQEGNANQTLTFLRPWWRPFAVCPSTGRSELPLSWRRLSFAGPTSCCGERFRRIHKVLPKCHLALGYWPGETGYLEEGFCNGQGEASCRSSQKLTR